MFARAMNIPRRQPLVNIKCMAKPQDTTGNWARHLRFQQLELLCTVAEHGNLGEAATRLHVSRAAVSKSLKELERSLGMELFERSSRGMVPTPTGLRMARHARLIQAELQQLAEDVVRGPRHANARLRIGMPPFVAAYVAPEVLLRLRRSAIGPHLDIRLHEGRLSTMVEQLLLGEMDAALTFFSPGVDDALDMSRLTIRRIRPAPMIVVAARDHAVATRKRHRWKDLAAHAWILPPAETRLRKTVDDMFSTHGARPGMPCIESASLEASVHLAAAGLGLAVVPREGAAPFIEAGRLVVLNVQPALPLVEVVLIYRTVSMIYMEALRALDEVVGAMAFTEPARQRPEGAPRAGRPARGWPAPADSA